MLQTNIEYHKFIVIAIDNNHDTLELFDFINEDDAMNFMNSKIFEDYPLDYVLTEYKYSLKGGDL